MYVAWAFTTPLPLVRFHTLFGDPLPPPRRVRTFWMGPDPDQEGLKLGLCLDIDDMTSPSKFREVA